MGFSSPVARAGLFSSLIALSVACGSGGSGNAAADSGPGGDAAGDVVASKDGGGSKDASGTKDAGGSKDASGTKDAGGSKDASGTKDAGTPDTGVKEAGGTADSAAHDADVAETSTDAAHDADAAETSVDGGCADGTCAGNASGSACLPSGACGCNGPSDCPAASCVGATFIPGATCTANACVAGTPQDCASTTPACNADTGCQQCNTSADCPGTGSSCVLPTCTSGTCGTEEAPTGTSCTVNSNPNAVCGTTGTAVGGTCVGCNVAADCAAGCPSGATCSCTANQCGAAFTQNGATAGESGQVATTPAQVTAGGGVGGVGGTGLGTSVTSATTLNALANPTSNGASQGLSFLYPYNATVFPRGMLAPLLMWTWSVGDADAIQIQLTTTTGSYSYTGTFGPPAINSQIGGKFINMPIPQDVWTTATNTAGGTNQLTLSLTVAKGGVGYGPISQTWTIAPALLSGTIYYQSYGTQLVTNYSGAIGGNGDFGAAILSIEPGATAPTVAAGTSTMTTGCRVCHSVGAAGSMLVVQHGDNYGASSAYALGTAGNTEHVMTHNAAPDGNFPPAIYADGSMALTGAGALLPLPTDTTPLAITGLPATNLGQPAFSPDGTKVAFNPAAGSLTNNQTLYVMTFDNATLSFSAATLVASNVGSASQVKPGWPAFFPDSNSVVFHHQVTTGIENDLGTRAGNEAQIYWTSLTSSADVTPLDNLNGVGYLPKLAAASTMTCGADGYQVAANPSGGIQPNLDHSQDATMNYEPTVNPTASGGYAWVVFTSRRMYGNVATIPPYCSDPRGVNLAANTANPLATNITTKKLWVAAVNLDQAAGIDSSHPAFYLPGQELLAGNARGFWSLDPCQADGTSCVSGDQCCNGYCTEGARTCSSAPGGCSDVGNKCGATTDCCDTTNLCVNGFCTIP